MINMSELGFKMAAMKELNRRGHSCLPLSDNSYFHINKWRDGTITWSVINELGEVIDRGNADAFEEAYNEYLKIKN
jgi:hypothetical protein